MQKKEAKQLARKMLDFNFHHALWFKKQLEHIVLFEDENTKISPQKLNILWAINDLGISTLPQLSSFLLTSKSSLSITITKMVKEGYISKEMPAPGGDRRKIYFYTTQKGRELLLNIEKQSIDSLAAFCQTLNRMEAHTLESSLHQLSQIYK